MALKKRSTKSQGEQLYMLEVFIDRLSLNPDATDASIENLLFRVRFADLPVYEINVARSDEAVRSQNRNENPDEYRFGKSCLFTKTPGCFIKAIRWSALSLELYDKCGVSSRKDRAPLATAKVSLPSCMCDQVIAGRKEINGIATPCTVKDTFDLTDSHGQVTGSITIVLRLSCFGSPIVEHFALNGKSFMLDDSPMRKFLCSYVRATKQEARDENGLGKAILKRPESPPRLSMNDPAFAGLTTAEKMNDPNYRRLIYSAYPNEPTCACQPTDRSAHPMMCRSGCTYPCCMKLRNQNVLQAKRNGEGPETLPDDTCCVNDYVAAYDALRRPDPACGRTNRLRGGGDIEQLYLDSTGFKWADYDHDYAWYDDRHNLEARLEGGGNDENGAGSCSCSGRPVSVPLTKSSSKDRNVVSVFDACQPRMTSTGPKPGCGCPGKDASKMPRGAAVCMKKPCQGIDCLIRAFKDAQDFVDSIGRVPGLPGLGLMDPSESPYFGRDIDRDYMGAEPARDKRRAPAGGAQSAAGGTAPVCTAPCGMRSSKPMEEVRLPFGGQLPRSVTVPPRLGIVREAIPVLPEAGSTTAPAKHRKKEEKKDEKADKQKDAEATPSGLMEAEVGPCGEPKCKSRRKKSPDNASVTHSVTSTSSKTRTGTKQQANPKTRRKGKQGKGGTKRVRNQNAADVESRSDGGARRRNVKAPAVGPGGDRDVGQPAITASKKVMRYVYFVGDYYPGINYGHRNCIDIRMRVPANMGWLWNTMATAGNLKPRIGWRPGAIGRNLYEMLQDAKDSSLPVEEPERGRGVGKGGTDRGKTGTDRARAAVDRGRGGIDRGRDRARLGSERARSVPSRQKSISRRQRTGRAMSYQSMQKQSKMEGEEEGPEAPPTLHIHRKDGTYYVTMYPIRQETSTEPRLAEPMKPLQFKIVKNKEDASDASSSTASDMEIEFSPPAAVNRYRKKPDVIHVDTQVRQQEILDAFKGEAMNKKPRRGRKEKKMAKPSKVSMPQRK